MSLAFVKWEGGGGGPGEVSGKDNPLARSGLGRVRSVHIWVPRVHAFGDTICHLTYVFVI